MIEVGRDKADLKAVRESIGITQIDLANEMDVTVRTIKRWEQIGWEEPPAEIWELLEDLLRLHENEVDELVRRAEEIAGGADPAVSGVAVRVVEEPGDGGDEQVILLAYYKNADHYKQFPHRRGTQHAWGNAVVRRAADILRMKGHRVRFYYPEAEDGQR